MTDFRVLEPYLPSKWLAALTALPTGWQDGIQEIRLQGDRPVRVSLPRGDRYLCRGGLTALIQPDVFICTRQQMMDIYMRLCDQAVYAHEWELRQGYIAVAGGIRVGVAGTAVTEDGRVRGVRQVTGLCLRLPRHIPGCAAGLRPLMQSGAGLSGLLLVGPPSSGKTTLLRDLASGLAKDGRRVAVVDERGEIAGVDDLAGCDVLRGYPKALGVRQAVRCLAPDVILFDELGDRDEIEAVADCAHAGVAVVATLHGHDPELLAGQIIPRMLIDRRSFPLWVFLSGRHSPGQWRGCYHPEREGESIVWTSVDPVGGHRSGDVLRPPADPAGDLSAPVCASAAGVGPAGDLHRPAHGRSVAAVGHP